MSLVNTLAKAAIGIALAKGVGSVVSGGIPSGPGSRNASASTSGGTRITRSATPGSLRTSSGLEELLGQMLGGGGPRGRGSVGGALEELSQMSSGSLAAPGQPSETTKPFGAPKPGSFGDMLNQSFDQYGQAQTSPTQQQEAFAAVLLSALIQAAKSDGRIDDEEKEELMKHLGDLDQSEVDFVNAELAKPVDVSALVKDLPAGAAGQVYMMSVMGIDLDTNQEARYLHELAQALEMNPNTVNAIHDRLGEPRIYR